MFMGGPDVKLGQHGQRFHRPNIGRQYDMYNTVPYMLLRC